MFSEIITLADQIGAIEKVKKWLLDHPDKAAEKLAESLDELYNMFKALDDEIVSYSSLSFESPDSINQGRHVLIGMEGGRSMILMNEARGHCYKITNIKKNYLNGWFNRVFEHNPNGRAEIEKIFEDLKQTDAAIIKAINVVSFWLTNEAKKTLNLLDRGDKDGAGMKVRQARLDVSHDRTKLTEAMSQLRAMQADFIAISKTD